jgi:hypothetical protein
MTVRWEDLADREHRCPRCLHFWVSHGVPGEDGYGCSVPTNSVVCRCTFAVGNPVTPEWVRHEPLPPI